MLGMENKFVYMRNIPELLFALFVLHFLAMDGIANGQKEKKKFHHKNHLAITIPCRSSVRVKCKTKAEHEESSHEAPIALVLLITSPFLPHT